MAFSRPRDVGLADDGQILVADTDNDRIVRARPRRPAPACAASAPAGAAAGQFKSPRSVTSDGARRHVGRRRPQLPGPAPDRDRRVDRTPRRSAPTATGRRQFRSPHCVTRIPGTPRGRGLRHLQLPDVGLRRQRRHPGVRADRRRDQAHQRRLQRRVRGRPTGPTARCTSPTGSTTGSRSSTPNGAFVRQWGGYGPQNGSLIFPRGIAGHAGRRRRRHRQREQPDRRLHRQRDVRQAGQAGRDRR